MKPVLTPEAARDLDRATQQAGTDAATLMERAGRAVAQAAVDRCGGVYGRRVVVVCGKGNNGGDGLVAARELARRGMRVRVVAMQPFEALGEPVTTNVGRLTEQGLVSHTFSPAGLSAELDRADVSIDAIFGTGFRGVPEGDWAKAIEGLNAGSAPVIAVDIPSGVDGATGSVAGEAVRAEITVTFGAPKVGVILLPGAEFAGSVRVVDIGFVPTDRVPTAAYLPEASDVAEVLPRRAVDTHKRATGVLCVVAGSRGMTGAPALVARAAMRMGAGLVVVAVPGSILPVVESAIREAVFVPLPETDAGSVASEALPVVMDTLRRADALALGPGLTQEEGTARFVRDLVVESSVPMVLDADGLNAMVGHLDGLRRRTGLLAMTPHDGEFARLAGGDPDLASADRIASARAMAERTDSVVLRKGSRSIVVEPSDQARINPTGTSALATAGSGDVLTGVIGALMARGLGPEAVWAGAYVHGLAGIAAGRRFGEGATAGDVIDHLPEAVEAVVAS